MTKNEYNNNMHSAYAKWMWTQFTSFFALRADVKCTREKRIFFHQSLSFMHFNLKQTYANWLLHVEQHTKNFMSGLLALGRKHWRRLKENAKNTFLRWTIQIKSLLTRIYKTINGNIFLLAFTFISCSFSFRSFKCCWVVGSFF